MTDTEHLIIDEAGGVVTITLNRPDHGNALTPAMTDTIADRLAALGDDVRVVVLRAEGADFCTGRAPVMPAKGERKTANDLRRMISDPVLDFYAALRDAPVPVIAEVRGRAAGVGCALAALSDVAVAADTATLSVPEMMRDIAPTLVMDALCDRVPRAHLARLILTCDPVTAAEAQALGLIGKVVPEPDLRAEVDRIASRLAGTSVATVRAVKAFLSRAPESSRATRQELAALLNATATAEKFR